MKRIQKGMTTTNPDRNGEPAHEQIQESEEEIRDKVELIQTLKIPNIDQVNIILVYLGLKPAATLTLRKGYDSEERVESILDLVGLRYEKVGFQPDKGFDRIRKAISNLLVGADRRPKVIFDIAKKQEDMDALHRIAVKALEFHGRHKEIPPEISVEEGRLYGYPETAIQAFVGNGKRWMGTPPPEFNENVGHFVLSQDHYLEEIELMKRWTAAIKKYAPDLWYTAVHEKQKRGA